MHLFKIKYPNIRNSLASNPTVFGGYVGQLLVRTGRNYISKGSWDSSYLKYKCMYTYVKHICMYVVSWNILCAHKLYNAGNYSGATLWLLILIDFQQTCHTRRKKPILAPRKFPLVCIYTYASVYVCACSVWTPTRMLFRMCTLWFWMQVPPLKLCGNIF